LLRATAATKIFRKKKRKEENQTKKQNNRALGSWRPAIGKHTHTHAHGRKEPARPRVHESEVE
jgi:hypothetical protein